jgi:putative membrane protein
MVDPPRSEPASRFRLPAVTPGQLLAGVLVIVAVVFIVQNRERVRINFFTIDVSAPVWLMLTVMVLIGVLIGALIRRRR